MKINHELLEEKIKEVLKDVHGYYCESEVTIGIIDGIAVTICAKRDNEEYPELNAIN